ncbi:MAG: hypothetical protein DCC75_00950 [Proteobacteria bacterium]|nr:MAG: hypothetical protein DCC75_00950 [Pseudomonadota bacterium]
MANHAHYLTALLTTILFSLSISESSADSCGKCTKHDKQCWEKCEAKKAQPAAETSDQKIIVKQNVSKAKVVHPEKGKEGAKKAKKNKKDQVALNQQKGTGAVQGQAAAKPNKGGKKGGCGGKKK